MSFSWLPWKVLDPVGFFFSFSEKYLLMTKYISNQYCVDTLKLSWVRKWFIWPTHPDHWGKSAETQEGVTKVKEERKLLTDSWLISWPAYSTQDRLLSVTPPTVGWALSHQNCNSRKRYEILTGSRSQV